MFSCFSGYSYFMMRLLKILLLMILLSWGGGAFIKTVQAVESPEEAQGESLRESLKSLKSLSPFKDVVVLQKRYFSKTHRFNFSLKPGSIVNDAYFVISNIGGELGFYFTERWYLFLDYILFSSFKKQHTERLLDGRGIDTSFVAPENMQSVGIKWVPMYGKVALREKKILYFDHYFSISYGNISLDSQVSVPSISFGTGQMFPLNKSVALSWDMALRNYEAEEKVVQESKDSSTKRSIEKVNQVFYSIIFSVGLHFFYPGVSHR